MAKPKFLHQLFDAHLADLKSVITHAGEIFICPICLRVFGREAIKEKLLTDGHVWPKPIRKASRSREIKNQRVLLCSNCNHKAGDHGDAQMGTLEKIREGQNTGQLYGERLVEIILPSDNTPIKLNANVTKIGPAKVNLTFESPKGSKQWARNNPAEQERFQSAISANRPMRLAIHPVRQYQPVLAKVGWLTSAYMFAFYRFGFRYIFHERLNQVRRYILDSFETDSNSLSDIPKVDDLDMYVCNSHYESVPKLSVSIPIAGNTPVHLFISLLDYHVRISFHFNRVCFKWVELEVK